MKIYCYYWGREDCWDQSWPWDEILEDRPDDEIWMVVWDDDDDEGVQ